MPVSMDKKHSLGTPIHRTNPFDSDSDSEVPSKPSRTRSAPPQGTNQSEQELESCVVQRAEKTSSIVNSCVRAAEAIKEDATEILLTLHRQGEQITGTHQVAADIEQDLTVSERLLGSLGGLFSKTWRPNRNQHIKGPLSQTRQWSSSKCFTSTAENMEQRQRLGISSKLQQSPNTVHHSPATPLAKVQVEVAKQDDSLSDLSDSLEQLKNMALGMGTEIERQNSSLDTFSDDVDELNFRLRGASLKGRRLLGK